MPITVLGGTKVADTAYEIANSCRFNDGDSAYMYKSQSDGDEDHYTISMWIKRGQLGVNYIPLWQCPVDGSNCTYATFYSDDTLEWVSYTANATKGTKRTNRKFRDIGAWYHLVFRYDSDNGTAGDRMRLYVNGVEETSWGTDTSPSSGQDHWVNSSSAPFNLGYDNAQVLGGSATHFDGYMAEVCLIDGSSLAPTSFGEFDDDSPTIWKPIDVSGLTFGTNGFYLDFEDSSNLGNDANGGTDLTESNLAATDQAVDTPTNSFCTMNSLEKHASTTLKEGNLDLSTTASGWHGASGTMGITLGSGPWYFEAKAISSARLYFGLSRIGQGVRGITYANATEGDSDFDYMWRVTSANTVYYGGADQSITITAISANDICACHVATDGEVKFYKNDSLVVTFSTKLVDGYFYFPILSANAFGGGTESWQANFGTPPYANSSSQSDPDGYGDFEYATKSGYALCTKNLGAYGG